MLRILIFSGGTGSIALQTGLHKLYGEAIKTDIIISAYDNGKSTGECRKVFNGKILGPSDLRKNQLTRFKLTNGINDRSPAADDKALLYGLLNRRFSKETWEEAHAYVVSEINGTFERLREGGFASVLNDRKRDILMQLADYFFFSPYPGIGRKVRETVRSISFSDFSMANLFYAAAAAVNGNSLGLAGSLMAGILEIADDVHLISDRNLYLHAKTRSGDTISDEGIIVAWDRPEDPIADVFLLDERGNRCIPYADEGNRTDISCQELIAEADIILFSSGTQWSSLIPTYIHAGLREMLESSSARKYLVMNNVQDRDMKGIGAAALLDTVERYISLSDVKIVLNTHAQAPMSHLPSGSSRQILQGELGEKGSSRHDPEKLVNIIFQDYFSDYLRARYHFFDFDDTVWSSSNDGLYRKYSKLNLEAIYRGFIGNSLIISGNSAGHFTALEQEFREAARAAGTTGKSLDIYCNGGNCHYEMKDGSFSYKGDLCSDYNLDGEYRILSRKIREALKDKGWDLNMGNFENRGNCILSIKPLSDREKAKQVIDDTILRTFKGHKYAAYINGNTTIDIMNSRYDKRMCAGVVSRELGLSDKDIVYVGDKTEGGNDRCLAEMGFKILAVRDIFDFYCFAVTYMNNKMQ